MPWGPIAVALAALLLLFILIYPFRVRVQYDKEGQHSHPLHAGVQIFGRLNFILPLHVPEESKQASGAGQGAPQGKDETQTSPASKQREGASASSTPHGGQGDESSLWRLAAGFVKVLFFDTGEDRHKRLGKKRPGTGGGVAPLILRSIRTFDKLEWETTVGTGDASSTALVVGALWSLKGATYTVLAGHVKFTDAPHFDVHAKWSEAHFDMRIDCIFRLRIGEIILAWVGDTVQAWQKGVHRFGHGKRSSH